MTSETERGSKMQIYDGKSNNILIVPISTTDSSDLKRVIDKNTSYFFLEPDEMTLLQQATLHDEQVKLTDLSKIEFVIGIYRRSPNEAVITSIYQVSKVNAVVQHNRLTWNDGIYFDKLVQYQACRVGDLVKGLPEPFQTAQQFSIK